MATQQIPTQDESATTPQSMTPQTESSMSPAQENGTAEQAVQPDAASQFQFEENTPDQPATTTNPNVEIKNKELLKHFDHGSGKNSINKTFVPWVRVGLLGAVVQLFLGVLWGILLNAEIGILGPLEKIVQRVENLQAILYLVALPVAYKILKRWAVEVPFVIATFSIVFLYGVYKLSQDFAVTKQLEAYVTGLQPARVVLSIENTYLQIAGYLLIGVFIFVAATFATNINKNKVVAFAALVAVVFSPYVAQLIL